MEWGEAATLLAAADPCCSVIRTLRQRSSPKKAIDPILGASYRNVIVGNDNSSRCSLDWMTIRIQGFCTGSKYI